MQPRSSTIINSINNNTTVYNILTAPTHERYQSNLSRLQHNFYLCDGPQFNKWNSQFAPIPKNHILLDKKVNELPTNIHFDIILSQNKFSQMQHFKPLADAINCPIVNIEHTWPRENMPNDQKKALKNLRADINVFISEISATNWGWDLKDPSVRIVKHGIDIDVFKPNDSLPKQSKIASCVNDWKNRDYACGYYIWERVTKDLRTVVIGSNPGLSNPAKDINELVQFYQSFPVFLNTSTRSPIPTVILEAMACGCCVVSTATCAIPDVIQNNVNGFVSNDENELRSILEWCLNNPSKVEEIGKKARKTIIQHYSLSSHLQQWNNIFDELYGTTHLA